jgi:hypothetical protein
LKPDCTAENGTHSAHRQGDLPTPESVRLYFLRQRHLEASRAQLAQACEAFNEAHHATAADRLLATDQLTKLRLLVAKLEASR